MESSLTTKGQVTIPKDVREHLHIGPGDRVKWFTLPDGRVFVLPILPASSLRGILKSKGKRMTQEEMDAAIAKGATARYRRFLKQK